MKAALILYFPVEVLFNQQGGDGGRPLPPETGILDIDTEGDLGIVLRSEGDEDGVVLSRLVLHCPCLAADLDAPRAGPPRSAGLVFDHLLHGPDDGVEVDRIDPGIHPDPQSRGLAFVADTPDEVRGPVPATVGQGGGKVGHLQGCGEEFALADRDGVDRAEIPASGTIDAVVVFAVRDVARGSARESPPQPGAESKGRDPRSPMVQPRSITLETGLSLAGIDHPLHDPVEIGIATVYDRQSEVIPTVRTVTPDDAAVAVETRRGLDVTFIEGDQALHHLPDGTRAVGRLDGPVEQRLVGV